MDFKKLITFFLLAFLPVDQRKLDLVLHVGDSFRDDDVIAWP